MKILNAQLTREADNYTIEHEPISSIDLMERAAERAANKILELYPDKSSFIIFAGPGNNGGDGLVIARLFAEMNLHVEVYILHFTENYSEDFKINKTRLESLNEVKISSVETIESFPETRQDDVLIDAVFGSGLSRKLSGFPEAVVQRMNESPAETISVDIPSGLFGEENPHDQQTIVKADHTLTFQYPSLSFMFPENEEFVGRFHVIDIGIHKEFIKKTNSPYYFLTDEDIHLNKRQKFSHKGTCGHALISAGSYGKAGASLLAVKAAHRAGAGLVTAHVPKKNAAVLHTGSPETMLIIDSNESYVSDKVDLSRFTAVGIGPGIGFMRETTEVLAYILKQFAGPVILDADAVTILSEKKDLLKIIPENSILTPHPKEFERVFGTYENNYLRLQAQIDFSVRYKIIIVLKGAHTTITAPDGKAYFNSTGNPGMATGGSGDVLTGIISSFAAQGYSPKQAAILGTFLHGKAGDIAAGKKGQTALIASDLIEFFPDAVKLFEC